MAINLELPKKMLAVVDKAHQGAAEMMRPIGRKYDLQEHAYPVELDSLSEIFAGVTESGSTGMAGAEAFRAGEDTKENRNGANMAAVLSALEAAWGDAAMRRSPGSQPTNSCSGWVGCGPRWPSPSRTSAPTPQQCRPPRNSTATST
jgi:hypothetical protein